MPQAGAGRVVVSSSDGRWERDASPSRWHEPLTLAEVDQLWQAAQREWVARLSAQHVVADTAGHFVHHDQPDLVAHVVRAVLQAARSGEPVHWPQPTSPPPAVSSERRNPDPVTPRSAVLVGQVDSPGPSDSPARDP